MRYNPEENVILISVRELVSTARRRISSSLPCDLDEPEGELFRAHSKRPEANATDLDFLFVEGEFNFKITVKNAELGEGSLTYRVTTDTTPRRPKKETVRQARGEGYIIAYIVAETQNLKDVTLKFIYSNPNTQEEHTVTENVSKKSLDAFFEKCKMSIKLYANPEIERVTERLPSMKSIKFPYEKVRLGQGDLVRNIYKNIARGGRLFISAPTGTGKTVSVLFPAIRAIGEGKCDKAFYFTPKTTTAEIAFETLTDIAKKGTKIKAVIIASKERLCKRGLLCREKRELCKNASKNNLADAVIELYNKGLAVVRPEDAAKTAEELCVCPHELSLSYAELCDIVILDINYLFDPSVYIRRFFSHKGDYAFLIDEAHNLPDRAREMYSASISESELASPYLSPIISELSPIKEATRVAADRLSKLFAPYLNDNVFYNDEGVRQGAAHLSEIPVETYGIFEALLPITEEEIFRAKGAKDEEARQRISFLQDYYQKTKKLYDALLRFNSSYELFLFLSDNEITVKVFCLDPGKEISERLDMGSCAVFFSGTLSPIHYYKSVLGGSGGAEVIETDSPFDSGQLSVSIMDKISTRLSERERTLDAVCRAIAATVSARRGNYMIFSPSFAYSEALASVFQSKYPKIKILLQKRNMTKKEKEDFLEAFKKEDSSYLIGFSVLGGIYSEGVDFSGESLIGAVIVGIGIPSLSYEREAMAAYYQDRFEEGKEFAYVYPGINRVLQAAGRVIRSETDRGVIVLIDDRFDDPLYKRVIPKLWSGMEFISTPKELRERLDKFWSDTKK